MRAWIWTGAVTAGLALALAAATTVAGPGFAQTPPAAPASDGAAAPAPPRTPYVWPDRLTNAQILPADAGAERLRGTMQAFTAALGVRCSHCHVGGDDVPLSQRDFASDANPKKAVTREMMRLTQRLNAELLPAIPGLAQPRVGCFTCHRGAALPLIRPPAPPVPPAPPAAPPPPTAPAAPGG